MKPTLFLVASALLLPFSVATLPAQRPVPEAGPALLTTVGSAEIKVAPELAEMTFEVEVRNRDLAAARKKQAEKTNRLLAVLRAAGVPDADLQTSQVMVDPDFLRKGGEEGISVRFYRLHQSIACTLHDLDKVPEVTDGAIAAGVTDVGPVDLRVADMNKLQLDVRARAMANAREKANAMTEGSGAKVGKPYEVTDVEDLYPFGGGRYGGFDRAAKMNGLGGSMFGATAAPSAPPGGPASVFVAGKITVSTQVRVSFVLE